MLLEWIGPVIVTVEPDAARAVADFHTAFNLVMAALFLPFLRPFARLLVWLLPARAAPHDPSQPIYLSEAAHEAPAIALAGAAREALRMADACPSPSRPFAGERAPRFLFLRVFPWSSPSVRRRSAARPRNAMQMWS